jgi:uncharacterized protein YcbK (DUF882 family)
MQLKYFTIDEFSSPDLEGSGRFMDSGFLYKIDLLRERFGKPIHINSGFRTEEQNRKAGGKSDSSHLSGLAVDISCSSSRDRHNLLQEIFKLGIHRVGIGRTFIHIDNDTSKDAEVVWLYN